MYGLDLFLIVFALLSGFLAMVRGFTREVLTLVAWVGAFVIAFWAVVNFKEKLIPVIGSASLTGVAILGSVFMVVLLVTTFIAVKLSNHLLDSKISALESSLGFVFGLFRGLVVIAILYAFFSQLVPAEKHPGWIANAKTLPLIDGTGKRIVSLFPEDNFNMIMDGLDVLFKSKEAREKDKKLNTTPNEAPAETEDDKTTQHQEPVQRQSTTVAKDQTGDQNGVGYGNRERQGLNQLLESTTPINTGSVGNSSVSN